MAKKFASTQAWYRTLLFRLLLNLRRRDQMLARCWSYHGTKILNCYVEKLYSYTNHDYLECDFLHLAVVSNWMEICAINRSSVPLSLSHSAQALETWRTRQYRIRGFLLINSKQKLHICLTLVMVTFKRCTIHFLHSKWYQETKIWRRSEIEAGSECSELEMVIQSSKEQKPQYIQAQEDKLSWKVWNARFLAIWIT